MYKLSYQFKQFLLGRPLLLDGKVWDYEWLAACAKSGECRHRREWHLCVIKVISGCLQISCAPRKTAVRPLLINEVNPFPNKEDTS